MRVQGNTFPPSVEVYPRGEKAEIRLRENPVEIDPGLYRYDEYVLICRDKPGLGQEIEANFDEWIKTAKALEVDPNSSVVWEIMELNTEEMGALIEEIYNQDVEMIDDM